MPDYVETPPEVGARLRQICGALPDAREEPGWAGFRWRVRNRTFVTVWPRAVDDGAVTRLQFRSSDPEFAFLVAAGHPFERAGWGRDVVNLYIGDETDWDEVAELLSCLMAPKRLAAQVTKGHPSP